MYYSAKEEEEVNKIINSLINNRPILGRAELHNAIQLHASMELGIQVTLVRVSGRRARDPSNSKKRRVIYMRHPMRASKR